MSQGVSKVTRSGFPPGSMCVLTVSALSFPESECVCPLGTGVCRMPPSVVGMQGLRPNA